MGFSEKLHNVATFAFLVVWVRGWGWEGVGRGGDYVRKHNPSSENKSHKLKKPCEKTCPSISKGIARFLRSRRH